MEYTGILGKFEGAPRFGSLPGVKISEKMLAAVGNPQKGLPFIHIAGTNGKGSTAAFLRSVLTEAGYRTGMYTSPHLEDFRERFSIDGEKISKEDFRSIGERILGQNFEVSPTMSDYCLLLSLYYFKKYHCDVAIFETGLGGRLDSTNALGIPKVGVLTKIGYDHTGILGNTISEIALEKAGILKQGCRAVSGPQTREAEEVFERYCRERHIPVTFVVRQEIKRDGETFSYPGVGNFQISMLGKYQRENALTAVLALKELKDMGYHISEEALHQGIFKAKWPGRMEVLRREPFLLADGAHNHDGVLALADSLRELYPGEKFHFVMGVLADKDYRHMADAILPLAHDVVTFTLEHERALNGEYLASYIRGQGVFARHSFSMVDAFAQNFDGEKAGKERKTVAFGSLYFVGALRNYIKSLHNI